MLVQKPVSFFPGTRLLRVGESAYIGACVHDGMGGYSQNSVLSQDTGIFLQHRNENSVVNDLYVFHVLVACQNKQMIIL